MLWRLPHLNNCVLILSRKNVFISPALWNKLLPKIYCSNVKKTTVNEKLEKLDRKDHVGNIINRSFQEEPFLLKENVLNPKKRLSKTLKYFFSFLGISFTILGAYLIFENTEYSDHDKPTLKRYLLDIKEKIELFTIFIQEPSREKLLPDPVAYPYYQPPYTLVLEFTDVLAHPDWTYQTGWRFKKRPGLDFMLENLVGLYEIVVFTAEPGMTIFPVIEALDQKHLISYKLVRDSTHFIDGHHVKNLDRLNRDLKKVIVVDWNSKSVKFHPDNHLNLPRWKGEDDDTTLIDLTSFLSTIAQTEIEDVREVLKFYKQFDDPLREFRNKQREYFSQQEQKPAGTPTKTFKRVFDYIM